MNLMCSNKTIKYLMFIFNFVFVITGIIIIAVGVSVKAHYYPYDTFLDDKYFSLPNMLIATGSLIFIISFLGCYGAMRENWVLLMAFAILLAIIFIFELSIGIAGYVLRDKTSSFLEDKLSTTMEKYQANPAISSMWDTIQQEFQCCGVTNSSDWYSVFNNSYSLPVSCCHSVNGSIGVFYCNSYTSAPTESTAATVSTASTESTVSTASTESTVSTSTATEKPSKVAATNNTNENALQSASLVKAADDAETTTAYPPSSSAPYTTGCAVAFGSFLKAHAVDIGAVGITLAVLQLFGIIFAFHLARQLKNGYYST